MMNTKSAKEIAEKRTKVMEDFLEEFMNGSVNRMYTANLQIRRFQENDLEDLYNLLSDNEVMKYMEEPYTK